MKHVAGFSHPEYKGGRQAAETGRVQPFSMYLTREFSCQFPDRKCPLCRALQSASTRKKDPAKWQELLDGLWKESKLSPTEIDPSRETHNTIQQLPRHDTNAQTLDALFRRVRKGSALNCAQAENCLNVIRFLLNEKTRTNADSSSASISVVSDTLAPQTGAVNL